MKCKDGYNHAWLIDGPGRAHCSYCDAVIDVSPEVSA
jgi:hypothetical protein